MQLYNRVPQAAHVRHVDGCRRRIVDPSHALVHYAAGRQSAPVSVCRIPRSSAMSVSHKRHMTTPAKAISHCRLLSSCLRTARWSGFAHHVDLQATRGKASASSCSDARAAHDAEVVGDDVLKAGRRPLEHVDHGVSNHVQLELRRSTTRASCHQCSLSRPEALKPSPLSRGANWKQPTIFSLLTGKLCENN